MSAYTWDAVWAVLDLFPEQVGLTVALVLLFVAIAFVSLLVPIGSVLSGGLTLCVVYGVADLVYEHGVLNVLGFAGLSSDPAHALFWLVPLLSFSVIVGIGLDYNVFLLVRVREYGVSGRYTSAEVTEAVFLIRC